MISRHKNAVGLAIAGTLLLSAAPAMAQVEGGSQELDVYAGEIFGDDVTDTAISGSTPKLDDDITYGVRYGYNFNQAWGLEVSMGFNPTSVTGLAGNDIDIDLSMVDINAVWHFSPYGRFVPYLTAGAGYAVADLDVPIGGTVNGQPVSIDDDSGFTLNAGFGAKYFVNDRFLIRFDARYRYLDAVVDSFADSPGTVEATLGIGWKF